MLYIINAFSNQMLMWDGVQSHTTKIVKVSTEEAQQLLIENPFVSAIGHKETADVVSDLLGIEVQQNRISVKFDESKDNPAALLCQLSNGRLPEGTTTLPEGFKFEFFKIYVIE